MTEFQQTNEKIKKGLRGHVTSCMRETGISNTMYYMVMNADSTNNFSPAQMRSYQLILAYFRKLQRKREKIEQNGDSL